MSLTLISFSADWCWPWAPPGARAVIGISRPKLDCTSDGESPIAVAACVKAAIAPQPMPRRYSVQKILALIGSRESRMPSMCPLLFVSSPRPATRTASEVHVDLDLRLGTRVASVEHRRVRRPVRDCVAGRAVQPVLQPDAHPGDRHVAAA